MFKSFLDHSIKRATRNAKLDLKLFLKVLSVISILYLFLALIYFGYNFNYLIQLIDPSVNPIILFNYRILHICALIIILQVFLPQNLLKEIIPYLHLPIKRNKIISYLLISSLFNVILISLFLFLIPYSVRVILPNYNFQQFLFYCLGVVTIFLSVNYLSLLFKSLIEISLIFIILPILLIIVFYLLNLFFDISFITLSASIFNHLIDKDIYFLFILICIFAILVFVNFFIIRKVFYKLYQNQRNFLKSTMLIDSYSYKSNIFDYALLEIKLITRNKRLKGFFWLAVTLLILFYYMLPKNDEGVYFTFIIYILISGMFGYIFSQYLFSWESSYFDFIFSKKFDIQKYLKAKYLIYLFLSLIVLVVFFPVIKPSQIETHMFISALLYNLSYGYFICFFIATYNKYKIDLNSNIWFNLQGFNSYQVLGIMLIILIPCILLFFLSFKITLTQSLLILNFICIIALFNQKVAWQIINNQLLKRKYINLEGYRE